MVLDEQITEVSKIRGNFETFHKGVRPSKDNHGVQNVFDRTISLNSHYMMLFKNSSDERNEGIKSSRLKSNFSWAASQRSLRKIMHLSP